MNRKIVGIFVMMLLIGMVLPISANFENNGKYIEIKTNSLQNGWYNVYGSNGKDGFYAVVQTPDNGYLAAGLTTSLGAGSFDAWLVKIDNEGALVWEKTFGGIGDDRFHRILQIPNGYMLVGQRDSDFYLVNVDEDGEELWSKVYGGRENEIGWGVQPIDNGGYILSGVTESYAPEGIYHMWLIKTDENGNEEWNNTYGEDGFFTECKGACQTIDGGYMLIGSKWPADHSDGPDGYLVKTDIYGNVEMEKYFEGAKWGISVSIKETTDNGFIMSGSTNGGLLGIGGCMAWLVKTNSNGDFILVKEYGNKFLSDTFWWLIQTNDGGYIGTGSRLGIGGFFNKKVGWFPYWSKICVMKFNADGNQEWGGSPQGDGVGRCIQETSDGGYIISGYTENYPNFGDGVLFKIDSEGNFP